MANTVSSLEDLKNIVRAYRWGVIETGRKQIRETDPMPQSGMRHCADRVVQLLVDNGSLDVTTALGWIMSPSSNLSDELGIELLSGFLADNMAQEKDVSTLHS